jgi:hypothetical protein
MYTFFKCSMMTCPNEEILEKKTKIKGGNSATFAVWLGYYDGYCRRLVEYDDQMKQ